MRVLAVVLLAGCVPPDNHKKPWKDADPGTPQIANFDLYCDVDAAKWELEVEATAWTGGGSSVWTVDGEYLETHKVTSFQAAADGTQDILKMSLKIVADWREAKNGKATTFRCAENPDVLFSLKDPDGGVVDCETFGSNPEVWAAIDGISPCE